MPQDSLPKPTCQRTFHAQRMLEGTSVPPRVRRGAGFRPARLIIGHTATVRNPQFPRVSSILDHPAQIVFRRHNAPQRLPPFIRGSRGVNLGCGTANAQPGRWAFSPTVHPSRCRTSFRPYLLISATSQNLLFPEFPPYLLISRTRSHGL